jgi:hypothetical protein
MPAARFSHAGRPFSGLAPAARSQGSRQPLGHASGVMPDGVRRELQDPPAVSRDIAGPVQIGVPLDDLHVRHTMNLGGHPVLLPLCVQVASPVRAEKRALTRRMWQLVVAQDPAEFQLRQRMGPVRHVLDGVGREPAALEPAATGRCLVQRGRRREPLLDARGDDALRNIVVSPPS